MGISFGSINTGLPKDIVEQIIAAERIPLQKMQERKSFGEEKLQLVNELSQLVEGLRGEVLRNGSARSLRELKVVTDEDYVDVTADKNVAEPGSYQFEIVQMAQKSSALSSGFEDPDNDYVGVGYIQYSLPNGDTQDVYIDEDHATLRGIAKLINKDLKNGMRALVINDGTGSETPWRLMLSLEETGDEMTAEFPYFYLVDGVEDLYLEFEREAHDAIVKIDGFEIEVPENKINSLIPGVTIDLKRTSEGEEFTIQIVEDVELVAEKMESLIQGINDVLQFIITQNNLDEKSDTRRTLGGDITLQTIESRIRSIIFQPIMTEVGVGRLGDLGVTFQRNGLLGLESQKFESALAQDFKFVSQVLTGRFDEDGEKVEGFVDRLKTTVNGILRYPDGILSSRKRGVQSKIDQIDRRIAQRERIISNREKTLKDKFARLEGTIARIRSQGAGLAALGAQTDPVTQLNANG